MKVAKYWRSKALRYRLQGTVHYHNNYSLQARPVTDIPANEERPVMTKPKVAKVVA